MTKWSKISEKLPAHQQIVLKRKTFEYESKARSSDFRLLKFVNMGLTYPDKYSDKYYVWKEVSSAYLSETNPRFLIDVDYGFDQWMSIDDDA